MPTASCWPSGRHAMQWTGWLVEMAKSRCQVTRYTETCESDVAIAMRSIVGHHSMATTSPPRPFGNPVNTSNAAGIATAARRRREGCSRLSSLFLLLLLQ
eukprot:scaffold19144_cov118-Isochrysis_galbana.AAC.4